MFEHCIGWVAEWPRMEATGWRNHGTAITQFSQFIFLAHPHCNYKLIGISKGQQLHIKACLFYERASKCACTVIQRRVQIFTSWTLLKWPYHVSPLGQPFYCCCCCCCSELCLYDGLLPLFLSSLKTCYLYIYVDFVPITFKGHMSALSFSPTR